MKRLSISTLLIGTLFFSCAKDIVQADPEGGVTTGRTIRKELIVQTTPMQGTVGEGATRVTTEVPLTEDEAKIHNLTVLQFGGTDAGSVLIKKTEVDVSEINATTGAFYFDFEELAGGGESKVYLLANLSGELPTLKENTTTLGEFEGDVFGTNYNVTEDGLPMMASQILDVATAHPAPFKLKSLFAKVVFSFDTATDFKPGTFSLYAMNLSIRIPVKEEIPGDAPFRPAGVDIGGEFYLNEDGTYAGEPIVVYIPECLAGRNLSITKDSERGGSNIPAVEATYFDLFQESSLTDGRLSYLAYNFYPGDGTPQDFNVVRHHQYTMHVTLRGATAADKRVFMDTANCYIIYGGSPYSNLAHSFLATVMGNGATTPAAGANAPEIIPAVLKPASAKVLWEQSDPTGATNAIGDVIKQGSVRTDGTYIYFTTGTKPGNAVIGAFDKDGTLIWSWHIWRTSLSSSKTCHTPYPTATGGRDFEMMDRNLGAFNNNENDVGAYGLMYQWGRKDPFPNATKVIYNEYDSDYSDYEETGKVGTFKGVVTENGYSFAAVQTSTGVTVQGGVRTPMNFYYDGNGDHNYDWLQNLNDNLWGTPYTNSSVSPNPDLGSKSIYDPCPLGYRVPPQDTWMQATTSNSSWATNGYHLGVGTGVTPAKIFYPSSGMRWGYRFAGKLAFVGSRGGYYWTSSAAGGRYSSDMGFHVEDGLEPTGGNYRATGYSVRCMMDR